MVLKHLYSGTLLKNHTIMFPFIFNIKLYIIEKAIIFQLDFIKNPFLLNN